MDNDSTFMWMIMGGPRYDVHTQDPRLQAHIRALRSARAQANRSSFRERLTRLTGFLGISARQTGPTLMADRCVAGC